jgi:hypothetical protein
MITFNIDSHQSRRNVKIVNIMLNGRHVCSIYPDDNGRGIRIITNHLKGFTIDDESKPALIQMDFEFMLCSPEKN